MLSAPLRIPRPPLTRTTTTQESHPQTLAMTQVDRYLMRTISLQNVATSQKSKFLSFHTVPSHTGGGSTQRSDEFRSGKAATPF